MYEALCRAFSFPLTLEKVGHPMAEYLGTVKWFNNTKGYGFIGHEGGPDVFLHYSSIQVDGYKTLNEGDSVTFDIVQGDKGPQADKVSRIDTSTEKLQGLALGPAA